MKYREAARVEELYYNWLIPCEHPKLRTEFSYPNFIPKIVFSVSVFENLKLSIAVVSSLLRCVRRSKSWEHSSTVVNNCNCLSLLYYYADYKPSVDGYSLRYACAWKWVRVREYSCFLWLILRLAKTAPHSGLCYVIALLTHKHKPAQTASDYAIP